MRTLFLDTEFNEWRGQLISIALVPDDGSEAFYMATPCVKPTPWITENVLPKIQIKAEPLESLQRHLHLYLMRQPAPLTIVADWPCDFKYLCELLVIGPGRALDVPMTMKLVQADYQSQFPHNALADAEALRDAVMAQ